MVKTNAIELHDTKDTLVTTTAISRAMKQLDGIKDIVPSMPTQALGSAYVMLKPYENKMGEVIKTIRDEFVNTRFAEKNVVTDDKGNKYIPIDETTTLKSEVVQKIEFDAAKANDLLFKYGLVDDGVDIVSEIKDGEKMVNDILTLLKGFAPNVVEDVKMIFADHITFHRVPNEQKIEALFTLGKLPASEAENVFNIKETKRLTIKKEKE